MRRVVRILALSALLAAGTPAADAVELWRAGRSPFHISLPLDAPAELDSMATGLRDELERVGRVRLEPVREAAPGAHSLRLELAGGADSLELGEQGFCLRVEDDRVLLAARTPRGLRHAVATFLEEEAGVRVFSPWEAEHPQRETLVLEPCDRVCRPAFPGRLQDFKDRGFNAFHKLGGLDERGLFVHTFRVLVPPERWFATHPEWFSENRGVRVADGQLCLTNPQVKAVVVEELRRRMAEQPGKRIWSVSQNDTYLPCACPACRAVDEEEGSPAGSILRFVNAVAAEFPDHVISTLAYQYSRRPPRVTRPAPNVEIMLCSIESGRGAPLEVADPGFAEDLEAWSRLTPHLFVWDYVVSFRHLLAPFPNWPVLAPNMRLFARAGAETVFEQGLATLRGEFAELRAYLLAKLLWDPEADVDSLRDGFLRDFYGAAAPALAAWLDTQVAALAAAEGGLGCFGAPDPTDQGHLAPAALAMGDSLFDEAEEAVRDDGRRLERVRRARLSLHYVRLHQARLWADEPGGCFVRDAAGLRRRAPGLDALLDTFALRCARWGLERLHEHGNAPADFVAEFRRFLDEGERPHLARGHLPRLAAAPSPRYAGGHPGALTDGLTGSGDYHVHWLGWEGEDLEAVLDLGASHTLRRVSTCFLQDNDAWIFLPLEVEIATSLDGVGFQPWGRWTPPVDPRQAGAVRWPLEVEADAEGRPARQVRLTARGVRTCPAWHKGAGGKSWVFCDELRVE